MQGSGQPGLQGEVGLEGRGDGVRRESLPPSPSFLPSSSMPACAPLLPRLGLRLPSLSPLLQQAERQ